MQNVFDSYFKQTIEQIFRMIHMKIHLKKTALIFPYLKGALKYFEDPKEIISSLPPRHKHGIIDVYEMVFMVYYGTRSY